jgi:hypothetical protein
MRLQIFIYLQNTISSGEQFTIKLKTHLHFTETTSLVNLIFGFKFKYDFIFR